MSSDAGPVSRCLDDSKPDGSRSCLVGFVTAEHYGPFSALDLEERKDAVVRQYAQVFGSDLFLSPSVM